MSPALKVLVVEDEQELAKVVINYFEREGYVVLSAFDGPSAVGTTREFDPDLIILDLMLPGFDGMEVCRQVRTFSDAYILMLTARDDEMDKLVGFAVGADDYVIKPFSPRELVARSKAILRRSRTPDLKQNENSKSPKLEFAGITLDPISRIASFHEQILDLTKSEFDILELLLESPKKVFSRKQLLDDIWAGDWHGELQVVDVHIAHLRKKITSAGGGEDLIRTIRGVGYGLSLK